MNLIWRASRSCGPDLPTDDMVKQTQLALSDAAEWLGDWHPLAEQLGSTDGLVTLGAVSASLRLAPVHNLASLRLFLRNYQSQILLPFELPAIQGAHGHAARHEVRELVALDQSLAAQPILSDFAAASRRVGQSQLRKLRPLRDQRVVQRYLEAVESGRGARLAYAGLWSDAGGLFAAPAAGFAGLRAPDHARLHLFGRPYAAPVRTPMPRPLRQLVRQPARSR